MIAGVISHTNAIDSRSAASEPLAGGAHIRTSCVVFNYSAGNIKVIDIQMETVRNVSARVIGPKRDDAGCGLNATRRSRRTYFDVMDVIEFGEREAGAT
ncbi:hypothetical protein EVAR_36511_1 [Eumeta japonica]|uniref:Uncharacterized protein n=1 Tax=Eumeta variegata TaxID=151549 RepID=A0A4C1X7F3_EUMVA|nr:hypothetical protein EVAR_36511_1 [Eumeta japonica]